ncbi:MAG: AAA family ATPase, partial [Acidimicrobiia bacterium]
DYVIVDTPAALTEIVLAAFDLAEHLFVMATVDLPSVRNLGVFLQTLERLRVPADNVSLILNKAERDVGLDVSQIVRLFPQGFRSILPYAREVSRSINVGMPVIASDPSAEVSRKLVSGLAAFFPQESGPQVEGVPLVQTRGRFAQLVQRCLAFAGGAA